MKQLFIILMLMVVGMAIGQEVKSIDLTYNKSTETVTPKLALGQGFGSVTSQTLGFTETEETTVTYSGEVQWVGGAFYTMEDPKKDSTITYEFEGDWLVLVIKTEWEKTSKDGSETTSSTDIIRRKVFKLPYKRTPEFWGHVLTTDGSGVTWGKPFGTIQNLNNQ